MKQELLHAPYSISYITLDEGPEPAHRHHFFELVYIISGTGTQCINQSKFDYHDGHMFLVTPEDCHSFDIKSTTTFFFLKFNNIYLKDSGIPGENIQRLEYILQNASHKQGCILKNLTDKQLVRPVVEAIIRETINQDIYNRELIQQLVNTLIVVVARNIAKFQQLDVSEQTEAKALDILHYIQNNIYDPEKLKADHLGKQFNISSAYLSRYFKQHTGETMQQYLGNYKTQLIVHRLLHSDKRITEIANEFNFTDESHFNKYFKKQKGLSPKEFRKQAREKVVEKMA
ncbi:AraC family transcriptional regulator [Chitinophaga caeni]|uniref:AraC family transcriptional regulator n=1 Tax=Chitinophaga caeni TaxID=2029983 RepID=A0A291QSR5_9BACT|nr:AraC family transcriptional regulator [Chitinophaga caeni]ATL46985.1 AraC family transcriptional regulator [Chitinophaga caeni]